LKFHSKNQTMTESPPPLRAAAFLPSSRVNGPGCRSVVWVQGCALRCPGCFNPDFLPMEGGTMHEPGVIADKILAEADTEGVSFSGGEPFLQAGALAEIARLVRAAGKSVVIFTGFEWDELRASSDPGHRALLSLTDTLVAGPYRREIPSANPILGSRNQKIVHLTARYRDEHFLPSPAARRAEFHIALDGSLTLTGFPAEALRENLAETERCT
jgi:anaerobic ribonucleoside-triphosphate reductase activating protein